MISSSKSWMAEAKSWLATPCTYTTAKCLSSHVHTLQVGAPAAPPSALTAPDGVTPCSAHVSASPRRCWTTRRRSAARCRASARC